MDLSDAKVFDNVAPPGEIAIPGSFAFANKSYQDLTHKEKLTFGSSWLGLGSFGYSTFVQVAQAEPEELDTAVEQLASYFVREFGAPSVAEALPVAQEELNYALSLCDQELGQMLSIERGETDEGVNERINLIDPSALDGLHGIKTWEIVDD